MWVRVWVLAAVGVAAGAATNDVLPPVEREADTALPHGVHHRHHNDVFPLKEEELDATQPLPHLRHTSRHHKVHNIVLHPEQNSMCELKPIRQIVTHALCNSKEMENHVCVGTCFSYTVPQTEPEIPGDELLDYCDSCQASESHWTTIQLDCEEYGNTYQVTKKIQMITNCSCSACDSSKSTHPSTDNEVTYPATDHRVFESFYKMLPESLQRTEFSSEYMKASLDDLRKSFSVDQEQAPHGKVMFKLPPQSFTNNEDEEDPNVVVSY